MWQPRFCALKSMVASTKSTHRHQAAAFRSMTDKHLNLGLFSCPSSFPLCLAEYYHFPCGVDREKLPCPHPNNSVLFSKKDGSQLLLCAFWCVLLMSLLSPPILIIIAVYPTGFPLFSASLSLFHQLFCLMWQEKGLWKRDCGGLMKQKTHK